MNRLYFFMSILAIANAVLAQVPRDRYCFHHRHLNTGGVCLLSSYCFILEYANSTNDIIAPFDNYDIMSDYLKYHNTLEPVEQIPPQIFRKDKKKSEEILSKAINQYCMARGWSGFIQVENFHYWLKKHSSKACNLDLIESGLKKYNKLNSDGTPLPNAYKDIARYLSHNTETDSEYDYAACVIFFAEKVKLPHAVFVGYDNNGYFVRDVNFTDRFYDITATFDFKYSSDAKILEYLIFRIKRPAPNCPTNLWKRYGQQNFCMSGEGYDRFAKLRFPIKIGHLRVSKKIDLGKDGTDQYTVIRFVSKSNPSFVVTHGNFYPPGYICVNEQMMLLGNETKDGSFEYDLQQICQDLYIDAYQPNYNFEGFYYQ